MNDTICATIDTEYILKASACELNDPINVENCPNIQNSSELYYERKKKETLQNIMTTVLKEEAKPIKEEFVTCDIDINLLSTVDTEFVDQSQFAINKIKIEDTYEN